MDPVSATTHGDRGTGGRWTGCGARADWTTAPECTHAVRVPQRPPIGVGYLQVPGAELEELTSLSTSETVAGSGLVTEGVIDLRSAGLQFTVTPIGDGPLLMVADDGRTTRFLRSCCTFTAADGRRGLGWVEWNHNQGRV